MQALPLMTLANFSNNSRKRSRASIEDDFDTHCLKKRLISTVPPSFSTLLVDDDHDPANHYPNLNDSTKKTVVENYAALYHNRLDEKHGETKYSIPGFVLSGTSINEPLHPSAGQLILYEKNPILASIEKELKHQHQQINDDDNNSMTSEEDDEEYDPMDLD